MNSPAHPLYITLKDVFAAHNSRQYKTPKNYIHAVCEVNPNSDEQVRLKNIIDN